METTTDPDDEIFLQQRERLGLIRDILEEVGAETSLFDALDQSQTDNDQYMNTDQPEFIPREPRLSNSKDFRVLSQERLILRKVLRKLEGSSSPSRSIDREIHDALGLLKCKRVPHYTSSSDVLDKLMTEVLPGFWETSGSCKLTGHASIGPSYEGPYAELNEAAWPEVEFSFGFHADLGPNGGGDHRKCLARLDCIFQALLARKSAGPSS